jgi:hypothetical protein
MAPVIQMGSIYYYKQEIDSKELSGRAYGINNHKNHS